MWRQMLDEAAKRRLPVLFVTNDQKEDWYRRLHGLTVGPRVELVIEMADDAGVAFHAQTLVRFVETAPLSLRSVVKEITVSEVNRLDEMDRASLRGELASRIAENEFERRINRYALDQEMGQRADNEQGPDQLIIEVVRLEARHEDLALRVAELQSELDSAREHENADQTNRSHDPRSYVRAVEARLLASTQMLNEVAEELGALRSERNLRTKTGQSAS